MSKGFWQMMLTVFCTVFVYYTWAFQYGLNENAGLAVSTAVAAIISGLLYRLKKRKK